MSATEGTHDGAGDQDTLLGALAWTWSELLYNMIMLIPFVLLAAGVGVMFGGVFTGWLGRIILAVPGSIFVLCAAGLTEQDKRVWPDMARIVLCLLTFIAALFTAGA